MESDLLTELRERALDVSGNRSSYDTNFRILKYILTNPGARCRDISREIGIQRDYVYKKVRLLERAGFIEVEKEGKAHLLRYVPGDVEFLDSDELKKSEKTSLMVLDYLREKGAHNRVAISEALGISTQTVKNHADLLEGMGLVEKANLGRWIDYRAVVKEG